MLIFILIVILILIVIVVALVLVVIVLVLVLTDMHIVLRLPMRGLLAAGGHQGIAIE